MIALALMLGLLCAAPAPAPAAAPWTLDEIFAALREVESGASPDEGRQARGDGGEALGPFQIHRAYWRDARVGGAYEECGDAAYSRRVITAYWRRWCPRALDALDVETLARVHNGGPRGAGKQGTLAYWRRVERALERRRARPPSTAAGVSAPLSWA